MPFESILCLPFAAIPPALLRFVNAHARRVWRQILPNALDRLPIFQAPGRHCRGMQRRGARKVNGTAEMGWTARGSEKSFRDMQKIS